MNRFNLAVSCFAIAAACLLAGGCGGGNSPKGAVSRYLEAMEDRDIETVLKLVNWEGEKTPHYRVTELAFIREWIMKEVSYYEFGIKRGEAVLDNPFWNAKQTADNLSKMAVEEETDSEAKVVCFMKNGGSENFYLDKVDGTWKIRYSHGDKRQIVSDIAYDRRSPFCSGLELDFFASKNHKAAQDAVDALEKGIGATSPKESAESLLREFSNVDMEQVADLLAFDIDNNPISKKKFLDDFYGNPGKALIGERMKKFGGARVVNIDMGGDDDALVTIECNGQERTVHFVRRNQKWLGDYRSVWKLTETEW